MKQLLKVYEIELKVAGPVFIGSGSEIGKKEYAFLQKKDSIAVFDMVKLFHLLQERKLVDAYSKFILGKSKDDMGTWLQNKGIAESEYMKCAKYQMCCDGNVKEELSKLSIMEFMRDSYGMPYVPGSSLKGMLRTILLAYDINNNRVKYQKVKEEIEKGLSGRQNRNVYRKEAKSMESISFCTAKRPDTNWYDAVNDIMSGVVIGDSQPLTNDDLILCRRIDLKPDGREKKLNVLRETIKPGVTIKFTMTIDTSICNFDKEYILNAVEYFGKMYYDSFLKKFRNMDMPTQDMVWLGGSTGFITKTEIYPMFGKEAGVKTTAEIFRLTKLPQNHGHSKDICVKVSPRICKTADYAGKRCHMGACHLKIS